MIGVQSTRTFILLVAALAVLATLSATSTLASSFTQPSWRPYSNPSLLVTLGMSKGEVLIKAGPPALEETISHGTDGHLNLTAWTYIKTGHNASVTVLTFQGNKLIKIDITLSN
jgi:outer membrane protein assembly factor BamE (lipoprotein component of BamABCDE complex)